MGSSTHSARWRRSHWAHGRIAIAAGSSSADTTCAASANRRFTFPSGAPENNLNAKRRVHQLTRPSDRRNLAKVRDPEAAATDRIAQSQALADWLSVETSARYARTPEKTFCNVYAADYGYLARAYLPRVWWTDPALLRIAQGELLSASLNNTVREMRADDLLAWLIDMGPRFGWTRVFDATALQNAANAGDVGVICADRASPGKPGHITLVVPEDAAHRAVRDADGNVTQPLQTQAGQAATEGAPEAHGIAAALWRPFRRPPPPAMTHRRSAE